MSKVMTSPWRVMRLLGVTFGYEVPTMPMIGLVKTEILPGSRYLQNKIALKERFCIYILLLDQLVKGVLVFSLFRKSRIE